jgi:hypothetical protein
MVASRWPMALVSLRQAACFGNLQLCSGWQIVQLQAVLPLAIQRQCGCSQAALVGCVHAMSKVLMAEVTIASQCACCLCGLHQPCSLGSTSRFH